MGRASNTAERRRQIAQALARVMARKGYDGASIGDVAPEAGLTPGLVHYHFENKLEILGEVLDETRATSRWPRRSRFWPWEWSACSGGG